MLLDLRGNIPAFIHISDGKTHEVSVLDILPVEAGAFYVMDKGPDCTRLYYTLHQIGAFFVIRAKRGTDAHRVYSMPADRTLASSAISALALMPNPRKGKISPIADNQQETACDSSLS